MSGLAVVRAAGAAVLVLFLAMWPVFPTTAVHAVPHGLGSPIVGFELASSPAEVFSVLGAPGDPGRDAAVLAMARGNQLDFGFLAAYAALHAGLALHLRRRDLLVLAGAMAAGDVAENLCLLALGARTDPTTLLVPLSWLRVSTTVKWGALFLSSALLARALWRGGGPLRWAAAPYTLAAVAGAGTLLWVPAIEIGAAALGAGWLVSWLAAWISDRPATS